MTKATHRIYSFQDRNGHVLQADRPTNVFYEIDAEHPLEAFGTMWLKIIRAKGKAYTTLFGTAPGVRENVVITDLGARMRLIDNHWYVDAMNINPNIWMPLHQGEPLSGLQWLAISVAAVTLIVIFLSKSPTRDFTPAAVIAAIIIVLCVIADHIRKRR